RVATAARRLVTDVVRNGAGRTSDHRSAGSVHPPHGRRGTGAGRPAGGKSSTELPASRSGTTTKPSARAAATGRSGKSTLGSLGLPPGSGTGSSAVFPFPGVWHQLRVGQDPLFGARRSGRSGKRSGSTEK